MPNNWFQSTLQTVGSAVDGFADNVLDQVVDRMGNTIDLGQDMIERIRDAGITSNTLAKETMELCQSTHSKSEQMIQFCGDLKDTLAAATTTTTTTTSTKNTTKSRDGGEEEGGGGDESGGNSGGGIQADAFDTIQDLLSGEKVHTAMGLAKEMSEYAKECVEKSVQMVSMMEDAMNALPDPLQKAIDTALREKPTSETPDPSTQLTTLDRDIADVQECLDAIGELNLFTALKVGVQALEQFALKAKVSRDMFGSIAVYAQEIAEITDAFCNLDFQKIILHKIKAIWKCLKLSSLIKTLAEGLGSLIRMVIDLFEATSTKVAGLWKALAFAKDCMKDCIEHALQARGLCENAKTKSSTLMERSIRVKDMLQDMGELNVGSIAAFRDLADGEEINTAIGIAMEMDDIVLECASKAVSMVDRVREGYANLPPMVTEGIPENAGVSDRDPEPANVEDNIVDLEASKEAINNANVLAAVQAGSRGFSNVSDKVGIAKELLGLLHSFAETCMQTIESFMGVWDIQSAIDKIQEMCRIVKLGEMMKQFASQIKRLLMAVIDLMKASIDKFKSVDLTDLNIGNIAQQASDLVQNLNLDDLSKVNLGKLGSFFN